MPLRMAAGQAPAWEVAASMLLIVAATVALVPLAARIYAGAVLRTGARVRLRQALRAG
jgi:ABC-2 type transport system permease protein